MTNVNESDIIKIEIRKGKIIMKKLSALEIWFIFGVLAALLLEILSLCGIPID